MSNRGDILITVILIMVGIILMIFVPLMTISNTQDDITQVAVHSLVADFVNNASKKGKITKDDYNDFIAKLTATGNSYDIQLEHQILTINPNKSETMQVGENLSYSEFNTTILYNEEKGVYGAKGEYLLKKGDYIIATVKNTNKTIGTQLANALFSVIGKDVYVIATSASALVVNTGSYSK